MQKSTGSPRKYICVLGGYFFVYSWWPKFFWNLATDSTPALSAASSMLIPVLISCSIVWASSTSAFVNRTMTGTAKNNKRQNFSKNYQVTTHSDPPFPVPQLSKKSSSALVIGRASSFTGMQYLIRMYLNLGLINYFVTHHIACSCSPISIVFERCSIKFLTVSSSDVLPASKPQESWKINPGLLSNINSFSMLWFPRYTPWVLVDSKLVWITCAVEFSSDKSIYSQNNHSMR